MLNFLAFISVAVLSLGQFAKLGELGGANLYLFDLLLGFFALYGTFYFLLSKKYYLNKFFLIFYTFSLIALLSLIWQVQRQGIDQFLSAAAYLIRWLVYLQAAGVVFNMFKNDFIKKNVLLKYFVFSGVFVALAGFIQLVLLPDFTVLDPSLGWDPHKNRLASTFFDPNFAGGYLTLIFTVLLFHLGDSKEKLFTKKTIYFLLTILGIAIFLTYSRSAWAMFGLAILIYGWKRSKWLIAAALLISFLAYFAVPRIQTRITGITDPADSARFRLISWQNSLEIAQDHLFLGVGFNAFKEAQVEYGFLTPETRKEHNATGSDSSILLVLATTGILGFIIFLAGYFYPLWRMENWFYLALLLPLFLQSQFINGLFYPQMMFFWLVLSGISGEIKV